MKKLLIIALLAFTTTINAQGHLKFKGVEINGTFKTFVANLEKRGCQSGENIFGTFLIKADFAGLEMMVYPQTTSQSQTVYAVVAGTSKIEEAVSVRAQYNELKSLLTQKYGEGIETTIADGYYRNSINELERMLLKHCYMKLRMGKYSSIFTSFIALTVIPLLISNT